MQAIFKTGGKQYKVAVGDKLNVEKIGLEVGSSVCFDEVLMVLDDGEIIKQESIIIKSEIKLYMLRSINTKICIKITKVALDNFVKKGFFESTPQKSIGRYYSFMPSALKEICLSNYNKYLKGL